MWDLDKFRGRIAVISEDGAETGYAELAGHCQELAAHTPKRSLVFCLCSNTLPSLTGYVAFLNQAVVPLMLPQDIDPEALRALLEAYQPDYVWLPEKKRGQAGGEEVFSWLGYVLLRCRKSGSFPLYERLALLLTTSGSTGSPKLVRQSYENIAANTGSIIEYLGLDGSERPITTLPMHYTYGLSIINTHLMVGAAVIMTEKTLMEREFWQILARHEATSFGGVPYTYEMLDKLMFFRRDLPSLRSLTQAGGKLTPELHRKFAEYARDQGKKFIVMYGAAEATARMGYLPPGKALEKCGSMGLAIPGGRLSLVDENGALISTPETVGELVYEGPNVTLGYAESGADLSLGDEWHGFLRTGDLAKFDTDGFFYIVGRKKRFLKIFGHRVSLDETEGLVKAAFPNLECACAGRDDALYVFVAGEAKTDEIRNHLAERTKLNPAAFQVRALKEIPKTESGKIQYKELEKFHA